MSGSVHSKLNRVRKPRVHITYEVETDGAQICLLYTSRCV